MGQEQGKQQGAAPSRDAAPPGQAIPYTAYSVTKDDSSESGPIVVRTAAVRESRPPDALGLLHALLSREPTGAPRLTALDDNKEDPGAFASICTELSLQREVASEDVAARQRELCAQMADADVTAARTHKRITDSLVACATGTERLQLCITTADRLRQTVQSLFSVLDQLDTAVCRLERELQAAGATDARVEPSSSHSARCGWQRVPVQRFFRLPPADARQLVLDRKAYVEPVQHWESQPSIRQLYHPDEGCPRDLAASAAASGPSPRQIGGDVVWRFENSTTSDEWLLMWIAQVMPNWPANRGLVAVRRLWAMGVPPRFRATVWKHAVDNLAGITAESYERSVKLASRSGRAASRIRRMKMRQQYEQKVELERRESLGAGDEPPRVGEAKASDDEPVVLVPLVSDDDEHSDESKEEEEGEDAGGDESAASTHRLIASDVPRTFSDFSLFGEENALSDSLYRILMAFAHEHELGYVQGISYPAAMLLLHMSEFDAFYVLFNTIGMSPFFRAIYSLGSELGRYVALFERSLAHCAPRTHARLKAIGLHQHLDVFLLEWFLTAFTKPLPHRTAARVFDLFLLDGDALLFKCAIALVTLSEAHIAEQCSDWEEAAQYLRSAAARDVDEAALIEAIARVRLPKLATELLSLRGSFGGTGGRWSPSPSTQ